MHVEPSDDPAMIAQAAALTGARGRSASVYISDRRIRETTIHAGAGEVPCATGVERGLTLPQARA